MVAPRIVRPRRSEIQRGRVVGGVGDSGGVCSV